MPFMNKDDKEMPVPVLAQTGKDEFEMRFTFRYLWKRNGGKVFEIPIGADAKTDLASVPKVLMWLVPRYGNHTLAALLHDELVDDAASDARRRETADTVFRDALGELNVPLVRRWMMWAAVSIGTMWNTDNGWRARIVAWAAVIVAVATLFWNRLLGDLVPALPDTLWLAGESWGVDVLLLLAASVLMLVRRVGVGLIAGPVVLLIFVPTLTILAALMGYQISEIVARGAISKSSLQANPVVVSRAEPVTKGVDQKVYEAAESLVVQYQKAAS